MCRHNHTQRSKSTDPLSPFLSHRGGPPAVFDWFFEAACPASLQEGEWGRASGEGSGDGRWAWGPEHRGLFSLQILPSCGSSPQTSGTRYEGWFLDPLGLGSFPLGEVVGLNMHDQAVCAFLHPQEAMQMVPKFCFPFDVEKYGRKQTSRDLGTQGLRHPGTQGIRDPNN